MPKMLSRRSLGSLLLLLIGCLLAVNHLQTSKTNNEALRRMLTEETTVENAHTRTLRQRSLKQWNLPHWANSQWCNEPDLPALHYNYCEPGQPVNLIRFDGISYVHGMPYILLGALESMEQKRCFVIDEAPTVGNEKVCTQLVGKDAAECFVKTTAANSLLQKYFEPIGLSFDDPIVQQAIAMNKLQEWKRPSDNLKYRLLGYQNYVPELIGYGAVDGHYMKRIAQSE